jgi:hypothetical protein
MYITFLYIYIYPICTPIQAAAWGSRPAQLPSKPARAGGAAEQEREK